MTDKIKRAGRRKVPKMIAFSLSKFDHRFQLKDGRRATVYGVEAGKAFKTTNFDKPDWEELISTYAHEPLIVAGMIYAVPTYAEGKDIALATYRELQKRKSLEP